MSNMSEPKFKIGDKVKWVAFDPAPTGVVSGWVPNEPRQYYVKLDDGTSEVIREHNLEAAS